MSTAPRLAVLRAVQAPHPEGSGGAKGGREGPPGQGTAGQTVVVSVRLTAQNPEGR